MSKTYGLKLKGLKKIECTYNSIRNDYHPHFHLILEGKKEAEQLVSLWLKQYPTAERKCQKIVKADSNSLVELCKYFTKIVNKDKFYPKNMDIIFQAMKGKRTFQPIGIKKIVSEEVDEIQGQEQSFIKPQNETFTWEQSIMDWVSASGEVVADYNPGKKHIDYIEKLQNNKPFKLEPKDEYRTKNKIDSFKIDKITREQIEQGLKYFWN
jgi:hypothetical protein